MVSLLNHGILTLSPQRDKGKKGIEHKTNQNSETPERDLTQRSRDSETQRKVYSSAFMRFYQAEYRIQTLDK